MPKKADLITSIISNIKSITISILAIASFITIVWQVDNIYAKEAELQLVSDRLDEKILNDRASDQQERVWKIEDR